MIVGPYGFEVDAQGWQVTTPHPGGNVFLSWWNTFDIRRPAASGRRQERAG